MSAVISSIPLPLLEDNIDTDVIFPARFLLLLEKSGLGKYAFYERRTAEPDFALNKSEYEGRSILVAGRTFGIGSSREQAVWALADLGIRCIIARSFGEIFRQNCLRNGLLPIEPTDAEMAEIEARARQNRRLTVDIAAGELIIAENRRIGFSLTDYHKKILIQGLDEVSMIVREDYAEILAFEERLGRAMPWISISRAQFESL